MKFDEFVTELKSNSVLVCRVGSGRSFYGELASATHFGPRYVKLKTRGGARIRINNSCGKAVCVGKFSDCFIAPVSRADSENFYFNAIC